MATRITVDKEFGADSWWDEAREAENRPPQLDPLINAHQQEVVVEDDEVATIKKWCGSISGWNEGTEYAPHPLLFNPAD
jgi:hypothetical protein